MSKPGRTAARPQAGQRPPHPLLLVAELRAIAEFASGVLLRQAVQRRAPGGDGHPVVVLPGLSASDRSTGLLRRFLRELGYDAQPWGLGRNKGLRPGRVEQIREQLHSLHARHGAKVSLVGQSLGGLFARELAKLEPQLVRQVITLGSPFTGHLNATNAQRVYERLSGKRIADVDPAVHAGLRVKPPVPRTSVYSKLDGVVTWHRSIEPARPGGESIHLRGCSHLGMAASPAALYLIAHRLAEPVAAWRPFAPRGWQRLVYGVHDSLRSTGRSHAAAQAARQTGSNQALQRPRRLSMNKPWRASCSPGVPAEIEAMAELPDGKGGKVLRRGLRDRTRASEH